MQRSWDRKVLDTQGTERRPMWLKMKSNQGKKEENTDKDQGVLAQKHRASSHRTGPVRKKIIIVTQA